MTHPHPLDVATALVGDPGSSQRTAHTSERYWTFISPFGGVSAATALRAVLERPERQGDPIAATVNFCAPIAAGAFDVTTRLVRANRSSQHWNVEFIQGGDASPVLTASLVLALRRGSWKHQPATPLVLPPADSLGAFPSEKALPWVQQTNFVSSKAPSCRPTRSRSHRPARARGCGCATPSRDRSTSCRCWR